MMRTPGTTRLSLIITVDDGTPIRGQVEDARGSRPFTGWLGLVGLLQDLIEADGSLLDPKGGDRS